MIVSLAITPVLTTSVFGSEESTGGFTTTAVLYALLAVTVITFMALGVRENPRHSTRQRPRFLRGMRSEEHTSELQSRGHLVCRLPLEEKKQYMRHGTS